jgi:hypothetical protein
MPDDDELDAIESTPVPALACEGSEIEIVDAELVEPETDRTDSLPSSTAQRDNRAGRTTYTIHDFER